MLQYMGLQRVRHDLATEQQQPSLSRKKKFGHWERCHLKNNWLTGWRRSCENDTEGPKKKKKKGWGELDNNLK